MISTRGLTKRYGTLTALDALDLEVRPGELTGFLGPNGAGKTTTLRLLAGVLPPSAGTASVDSCDLSSRSLEARRRVGYLAENNPLYDEMSVGAYLEWTADVRGFEGAERLRRVRRAVESCGLGDAVGEDIGTLSKGYRQRVGLAAAVLHDPPVLLLDEPTSGLDPNQAREVRALIARMKEGKVILFSTHLLTEAQELCDRLLLINRGRIAADGAPAELLRAAGTPRLRLLIAAGPSPEEVRSRLKPLPGCADVEIRLGEGGTLEASVEAEGGADPRGTLSRCAAEAGWTLLELRREEPRLDDVFRELTRP